MKYQILSFFGEIHWQWFQTRFKKNRTEASNEVKHQIHFKFQAFKDRRNEWETMVAKVGLMKISSKWHSFTKVAGQRCGELFQRVNSLSFPNKLFGTWTVLAQKRVFFFVIFFKPDEIPSNLFTLNITKWTNEWWILIIWDGFPFEGVSQRLNCGLGGKKLRDFWLRPSKTKEFQHVPFKTSSTSTDISSCPKLQIWCLFEKTTSWWRWAKITSASFKPRRSFDPKLHEQVFVKRMPAVKSCEVQTSLVNSVSKKKCPKSSEPTSVSFCLPESVCNLYSWKTALRYRTEAIFNCASVEADMKPCKGTLFYSKNLQNTFITQKKKGFWWTNLWFLDFCPKNKQSTFSTSSGLVDSNIKISLTQAVHRIETDRSWWAMILGMEEIRNNHHPGCKKPCE